MSKGALKIIHKNDFGLIGICKCCGEFHVHIGRNIIMALNLEEFIAFENLIDEVKSYAGSTELYREEKLMIRVDEHGFILSLTEKELEHTIELFEMSRILLSAKELIA